MNANIGEAVLENIKISVVTPVYKAAACLDTLYAQLDFFGVNPSA